jgi:hypothetical protein
MSSAMRWLGGLAFALLGAGSALAADAPPAPNYQGLWWNSPPESESGWGINLAHQGDVIFATWFTYDAASEGWWLAMTANRTADGRYGGVLVEATGPAFSAVPFDPARVARTAVGSGILSFRDLDNGTLTYTLKGVQQTKYLTRFTFGPVPTCTAATQAEIAASTNYQDLWWVPGGAESGWGINLVHQGDSLFATWYTYEGDGTPMWLAMTATRTAAGVYRGQLVRTTGPAFSSVPFDPSKVTRTVAGTGTLAFANGSSATFSYTLYGVSQSKTITRFPIAAPWGTRCGEPYRTPGATTIVAVGDIAQCFGAPATVSAAARTAELIAPTDSLLLTLGDHAYEVGSHEEFANCYHPTWGAFKDRTRPTPGNHEYYTPAAAGYYDYFGAAAGPDRRGYYSFDVAGWHVIVLNSLVDITPQSAQHRWLVEDLEKSRDSLCTIATLHYPPFNSGADYGGVFAMRPVFDLLQSAGVEMLLSGHEHIYERFAPQRADGSLDAARGLRQFVVGTGGHTLNRLGPPAPNSEFRTNTHWGILRLTLGYGTYRWQFVPIGGGPAIDSGSATCHP